MFIENVPSLPPPLFPSLFVPPSPFPQHPARRRVLLYSPGYPARCGLWACLSACMDSLTLVRLASHSDKRFAPFNVTAALVDEYS